MNGWVRIRSWHRISFYSRGGQAKTRCGLWVRPPLTESPTLPLAERSCENCLRYTASDEYVPEPANDTVPG